jgi:hypothetical protein
MKIPALARISHEVITFAEMGTTLTLPCIRFARQHIMPILKHHVRATFPAEQSAFPHFFRKKGAPLPLI